MKARLKDNYKIDLNHTLIAGAEVEITDGWCGCDGYYYNCILPDNEQMYVGGNDYAGTQHVINDNILDIIDHTPYINWEQRRYEIAKKCVAVLMRNEITLEDAAKISVEQADALIKELKKEMEAINE